MATKFTKGGLLSTTQLESISGKKWKKGGILSADQLNELSSGGGGLELLYRSDGFVKAIDGNSIEIDGSNLIIDFGIPIEVPDYVYMGASPAYAGSYFYIISTSSGHHEIRGLTISGTTQTPKSGTVTITKENETTLKFSSSNATEFQDGKFWSITLYKEN